PISARATAASAIGPDWNVNQRTRNSPVANRMVGMPPICFMKPSPPPSRVYCLAFLLLVTTGASSSPPSSSTTAAATVAAFGGGGGAADASSTSPLSSTRKAVLHFLHLILRPMSLAVTAYTAPQLGQALFIGSGSCGCESGRQRRDYAG